MQLEKYEGGKLSNFEYTAIPLILEPSWRKGKMENPKNDFFGVQLGKE